MKLNGRRPTGPIAGPRWDPYALHDSGRNIYENEASGITHKYPHTVRFALTDKCSHGCDYCYEAGRVFGTKRTPGNPLEKRVHDVVEYARSRQQIYDMVLSGGEPLILPNDGLEFVLRSLAQIPHLKDIRFCTYSLIKTPDRIDNGFLAMLDRFSSRFSVQMMLHVVHPDQLTETTKDAIRKLLRAGARCFSQVPLLKGKNLFDDAEKSRLLLKELLRKLNDQRIAPYSFVVKMAVPGTEAYAMPLERIVEIFRPLLQHERDSIGLELTFKLMVAAPETKVFLYPETRFEYDGERGGYVIHAGEKKIFYPYEDPSTL